MQNPGDNLLSVKPVLSYEKPKIPTMGEMRKNPAGLKKLPGRWVKNAAIITGLGMLGISALAGCDYVGVATQNGDVESQSYFEQDCTQSVDVEIHDYDDYEEPDLLFRLHGGGAATSFYVVHFTEQEAFGMILAQLESAGLRFCAEMTEISFRQGIFEDYIRLNLLRDPVARVVIANLNFHQSDPLFHEGGQTYAGEIAESLAEHTDFTIGVFYTPHIRIAGIDPMHHDFMEPPEEETEKAKLEARPILEQNILTQANRFIDYLRREGIIE